MKELSRREKYLIQAEELFEIYGKNKLPEVISDNNISPEFIKEIYAYYSNILFVQMLSDDLFLDGKIDWNDVVWTDKIDEDVLSEACRRLQWRYDKSAVIEVDRNFIAMVLQILDEVAGEHFMRDFI